MAGETFAHSETKAVRRKKRDEPSSRKIKEVNNDVNRSLLNGSRNSGLAKTAAERPNSPSGPRLP